MCPPHTPASTTPENTISRAADLWFDDGSVVLQVESTQFRVHRSVLARNSDVFRQMFSLPQAAIVDADLVEGCPVVVLPAPDKAKDWTYVLQALYSARNDDPQGAARDFREVAAFLRLGSKYDIIQLRRDAMKLLSAHFPSTLERYDKFEAKGCIPTVDWEGTLWFDVINLARETNTFSILPAAFLMVCNSFDIDEILDGIEREDGVSLLSIHDQKVILRGWHKLIQIQFEETFQWMTLKSRNACFVNCRKCSKARRDILDQEFDRSTPSCRALDAWDSSWEMDETCESCDGVCKGKHDLGRAKIWDKLPSIFDLPPWDKLLNE